MDKGQGGLGLIVGLLIGFMVVTILITLMPGFIEMQDTAMNSENLNCKGYNDTVTPDLSYNSSAGNKSTMGCLAMKLYIPYIILGVLIALVVRILYDKGQQQQSSYYG